MPLVGLPHYSTKPRRVSRGLARCSGGVHVGDEPDGAGPTLTPQPREEIHPSKRREPRGSRLASSSGLSRLRAADERSGFTLADGSSRHSRCGEERLRPPLDSKGRAPCETTIPRVLTAERRSSSHPLRLIRTSQPGSTLTATHAHTPEQGGPIRYYSVTHTDERVNLWGRVKNSRAMRTARAVAVGVQ